MNFPSARVETASAAKVDAPLRGAIMTENLRAGGATVPDIIKRTGLSKASIYRALGR